VLECLCADPGAHAHIEKHMNWTALMTTALSAVALLGPLGARAGTQQDTIKTCNAEAKSKSLAGGATSGAMAQVLASLLQQQGGLVGLVEKLGQSGLGPQVQSWVSNSQNVPVTGAQVASASSLVPAGDVGR
jgi:uncharacterized protein YidB (DUF937 family)